MIQCEYQRCKTSSYVRCAAKKGWIYHWNDMATDLDINSDDQERPVFCNKCRERGTLTYKIRGMDGLQAKKYGKSKPSAAPGR